MRAARARARADLARRERARDRDGLALCERLRGERRRRGDELRPQRPHRPPVARVGAAVDRVGVGAAPSGERVAVARAGARRAAVAHERGDGRRRQLERARVERDAPALLDARERAHERDRRAAALDERRVAVVAVVASARREQRVEHRAELGGDFVVVAVAAAVGAAPRCGEPRDDGASQRGPVELPRRAAREAAGRDEHERGRERAR